MKSGTCRPRRWVDCVTYASPDYLAQFGYPETLEDLAGPRLVRMRSLATGVVRTLDFVVDENVQSLTLPMEVSVTGPESYRTSTLLGLGLA